MNPISQKLRQVAVSALIIFSLTASSLAACCCLSEVLPSPAKSEYSCHKENDSEEKAEKARSETAQHEFVESVRYEADARVCRSCACVVTSRDQSGANVEKQKFSKMLAAVLPRNGLPSDLQPSTEILPETFFRKRLFPDISVLRRKPSRAPPIS